MKRLLFFSALIIAAMQMMGANVDLATAKATAQQYAASKMANGKQMAPSAIDLKLVKQEMNSNKPGTAVYYIFNTDDHFIIISGDDRAPEVLAYGDRPLDEKRMMIGRVVVLPEYRRQGIGTMVVSECEVWAEELGYSKAVVESRDNKVEFYEQMLYEVCGEAMDGDTFRCIRMEKDL